MGDWITATTRCFRAAIADGGIVLGLAVAGTAVVRKRDWFRRLTTARIMFSVVAGASVALLIERLALGAGRWGYGPQMPLIPRTNIGLVPVVQMIVLPLIVFRFAVGAHR